MVMGKQNSRYFIIITNCLILIYLVFLIVRLVSFAATTSFFTDECYYINLINFILTNIRPDDQASIEKLESL